MPVWPPARQTSASNCLKGHVCLTFPWQTPLRSRKKGGEAYPARLSIGKLPTLIVRAYCTYYLPGAVTGFGSSFTGTSGPVVGMPMLFLLDWPVLEALGSVQVSTRQIIPGPECVYPAVTPGDCTCKPARAHDQELCEQPCAACAHTCAVARE